MSRIDEAWKRSAGTPAHSRDSAARAERFDEPQVSELHHYPREAGKSAPPAPIDLVPSRALTPPRASEPRPLGPIGAAFGRKLVVGAGASPIVVEQYRRLAGTLHDLQLEQGLKTLMVTSALPHEGKTLTVANLALTLSEACRRRVLLIDADLRRPCIHEIFRLPNTRGLSDVLDSPRAESPVLLQVSEYLTVLPAGKIEQPMALTSDRMRVLLEQSAATFDWVLIDAAPVGFMPDAQLLAHLTRAVLFVIAANATPHTLVSRAIAELGPECVVGTVLNCVEPHNIPSAAYYHDYYATGRPPTD